VKPKEKDSAFANAMITGATGAARALSKLPSPSRAPLINGVWKGVQVGHSPAFHAADQFAHTMMPGKVAMPGTNALPPAALKGIGALHLPKSGKAPIFGSGDFGLTRHVSPGVTAVTQTAQTVAPGRLKVGHAELTVASFLDELEKIAVDGGITPEELALFKQAFIGPAVGMARKAIGSGASALGGALERGGMGGASRVVHAFNSPIETGAAGHGLVHAGQHLMETAGSGAAGGLRYGAGHAIASKGADLKAGGLKSVAKAALQVANPAGTLAEVGATGLGHVASRAAKLNPQGMAHAALTKGLPQVAGVLGSAAPGVAGGSDVLGSVLRSAAGSAGAAGVDAIGSRLGRRAVQV
jgi:hypothetical protein